MKAVILAGGLGMRLREETEFRPKPMVEIGGRPILWHLMKILGRAGLNEFVVCTGYRGEVIKDYFLNYEARNQDFTIHLGSKAEISYHGEHDESDWTVTVVDTGQLTQTGGRVKRVESFVDGERCLVTYGDGLADLDVSSLLAFHKSHGRLATVTTVRPPSRFGVMDIDSDGLVEKFREKPQSEGYVNAGFFVFEPGVFEYLDDDSILEHEPLAKLAADGELHAYRHDGFWQPMDTYREFQMLNDLWGSGAAPW
jgi:glucose-1-phosphate cytidylyltransferase